MSDLREDLAALSHEQWSGWMRYLYAKSAEGENGQVVIPPDLAARWRRQMNTLYADLPEKEKNSDRVEADKVLAALSAASVHDPALLKTAVQELTTRLASLDLSEMASATRRSLRTPPPGTQKEMDAFWRGFVLGASGLREGVLEELWQAVAQSTKECADGLPKDH